MGLATVESVPVNLKAIPEAEQDIHIAKTDVHDFLKIIPCISNS